MENYKWNYINHPGISVSFLRARIQNAIMRFATTPNVSHRCACIFVKAATFRPRFPFECVALSFLNSKPHLFYDREITFAIKHEMHSILPESLMFNMFFFLSGIYFCRKYMARNASFAFRTIVRSRFQQSISIGWANFCWDANEIIKILESGDVEQRFFYIFRWNQWASELEDQPHKMNTLSFVNMQTLIEILSKAYAMLVTYNIHLRAEKVNGNTHSIQKCK